jgi:hypothetical protein
MRVAYVTTDQVNGEFAHFLAEKSRLTLDTIEPRDGHPNGEFDAVIYDWDYLPGSLREEVLAGVSTRDRTCPVAVHSYFLRGKEINRLRDNGVEVYRHLSTHVFEALRAATESLRR